MLGEKPVTLMDTPGHVDFSAEMERTLQVLDYAILIISAPDGVQGHVETLWRLLKRYEIPVFLFINKMDQEGTDRETVLRELQKRLSERCLDFGGEQNRELFHENLAMCEEEVLEYYLEHGQVSQAETLRLIEERKVFPCFFGSALKLTGVDEFLAGLDQYTECPWYPDEFGARVFKITRDEQGGRLTHLKVTGGSLKVKALLAGRGAGSEAHQWEEKVNQIRLYSGTGYEMAAEAPAGTVCAVTGLSRTYTGEGLGAEPLSNIPLLEPVLTYRILLPEDADVYHTFTLLRSLEEEVPELHLIRQEGTDEIHAQVMGEVQIEILKSLIAGRFGLLVEFDSGSIVYKETIAGPAVGVGHFEPLRHYAEVHLLLEPGEPGSGMQYAASCSEDVLSRNWQRLVLTHLDEKQHKGVLTGAELTDVRITLLTGRAHAKHTEGGDFRQATYRAVRQGLKQSDSVLLEPVYGFRLELPADKVGRAMADIQAMSGRFDPPGLAGDQAVLTGSAPVAAMQGYHREVIAYTGGYGRFSCFLKGYEPCHNADEIIAASGYDSELDPENPTGSVFCAHGAGFAVPWYEVADYQHLDSGMFLTGGDGDDPGGPEYPAKVMTQRLSGPSYTVTDQELEEIFTRTYGAVKRKPNHWKRTVGSSTERPYQAVRKELPEQEYLLVDGYNIIFAWEELKDLADVSIDGARSRLMDILSNYQGYKKITVILVFDAYKVEGGLGSVTDYQNIHVVYTKEAETADQYIEKTVHRIGRKYQVTVATSDILEQVIILGQGARRMSAPQLKKEIEAVNREIREEHLEQQTPGSKNYLFGHLDKDMQALMEAVRLGKKDLNEEEEK